MATSRFLPTIGGAEIAVHHLSNALTRMGEEVVAFIPRNKSVRKFITDYKIECYPLVPKGQKYFQGYVFAAYLYFLQKRYNFDLIHVHKAQISYYAEKIKRLNQNYFISWALSY